MTLKEIYDANDFFEEFKTKIINWAIEKLGNERHMEQFDDMYFEGAEALLKKQADWNAFRIFVKKKLEKELEEDIER